MPHATPPPTHSRRRAEVALKVRKSSWQEVVALLVVFRLWRLLRIVHATTGWGGGGGFSQRRRRRQEEPWLQAFRCPGCGCVRPSLPIHTWPSSGFIDLLIPFDIQISFAIHAFFMKRQTSIFPCPARCGRAEIIDTATEEKNHRLSKELEQLKAQLAEARAELATCRQTRAAAARDGKGGSMRDAPPLPS